MKTVVLHPEAEAELLGAAEFYESRSPGLGLRFLTEVERGLSAVAEAPDRSPRMKGDVRRWYWRSRR